MGYMKSDEDTDHTPVFQENDISVAAGRDLFAQPASIPTDGMLSNQWHLINPSAGLLDLNVEGAWNPSEGRSYTGRGVRVAVLDDGFDYTHISQVRR